MKYTVLAFFLVFLNFSCAQSSTKSITDVSQEELKKGVLLDVRTAAEFNGGHLMNAVNIDWFNTEFQQQVEATIPKDKTVYVYCKMGGRSAKAAEKLAALGYKVTDLTGGYDAYKNAQD